MRNAAALFKGTIDDHSERWSLAFLEGKFGRFKSRGRRRCIGMPTSFLRFPLRFVTDKHLRKGDLGCQVPTKLLRRNIAVSVDSGFRVEKHDLG